MSSVTPEIHEQYGQAQVADLAARRAYEQAWAQFAQQRTPEEFCASWLLIQCQAIGGVSDGVVVLQKSPSSSFAPVAFYPEKPRDRNRLARVAESALKAGHGIVEPVKPADAAAQQATRYQLAYPVRLDGQVRGVVGVDIDPRPEAQVQAAIRNLQWGSGWLELLLRRHSDPREPERLRLKMALDVVATLLEQSSFNDGATAFATQLATELGCDRVCLGLLRAGRVRVRAVSHSPHFERRANLLRAVEDAMEEAIDQGERVVHPDPAPGRPLVARAHAALLQESGAGSAATFPLRHADRVVGALTLERAAGHPFDAQALVVCEAVASVAGPIVELKRDNETSLPAHAGRSGMALWRRIAGPGHAGFKLGAAAFIALAAFLALASGEFRISANASLEGTVQRAITAPINGYVKEAALRAGDVVKAGQVIGRFDDRDLRLERLKLHSQRDQFERQYREAMGRRERAQAQIVSAQIAQVEAQLGLIDEQLERTVMLAPFEGVIVSGDLSQNLGSPVERGQVLFQVAPLERHRVVLQVDERDIAHVVLGQSGELTVASIPGERFAFSVRKITSVNTAKEGRNFFRVEAELQAEPGARLRPGMEGVGKIGVDERKLVWIWTRSSVDWLRLQVWSLLP
jgi:RND family efflux transporter MFP subunit